MSSPLLQVRNVSFAYRDGSWQLRDISFNLPPGELIGIIGPNGAGKSSLLKLSAAILQAQSGEVLLAGSSVYSMARLNIARQLGYLPQQISSLFDYRVEDIVGMGRFPHLTGAGFLQAGDLRKIEQSLEMTDTLAYRHRLFSHLSGGERQRVLLASVLAQEPKLLLLDEPTNGLDLHHQVRFFRLLRELASNGIGIIIVSHDLNLAGQFCNRLILLAQGRLVKIGTVSEVLQANILSRYYGDNLLISCHPQSGLPVVLPRLEIQPPA